MTLLDRLHTHKGGLVQIKSELFWYDGRGWDGVPGRIGLVLDARPAGAVSTTTAATPTAAVAMSLVTVAVALLLVDGAPHWVWVVAKDIELLDGDHQ